MRIQADEFLPRPATPPYIPKKTGIDKITQIEDYDLFEYDREVQPILNVLLTKTIEQALLEVEEETEIDEIRKFKSDCYERLQIERDEWAQEVKREIARIKQKNKALNQRRLKREQQIKTMRKLQCLAIARESLQHTFVNCISYLQENNQFRNKFEDQLNVSYREWLFKKVDDEFQKGQKSDGFQNTLLAAEVEQFAQTKEAIKKGYESRLLKKEKIRRIESESERSVHYLFNPNVSCKITPFTRKYKRLLDGTL